MNQQGKTYILQTDVTTDGTAFAIIASDVTFDLNGHTITYDNAAPIVVPNGSFETGIGAAAAGWNFSNAPNATRHQGDWLRNEIYDGEHSLKFSLPAGDQYVVSTSTITLEANTTYSLSAMFEYGGEGSTANPGAKGYVRLVGSGLPTREVNWNSSNWRGIQLQEGTFTTGNNAETYYVQVGVASAGSPSPTAANAFYIDDIKIQRTKVYGVTAAAKNWSASDYPGLSQWGTGTNATIKNGTIVQGADGATWAHGVFIHTVGGVTVQDLNITVHGANSSTIDGKDQGILVSQIVGNTLTSNVKTISSRDNFDGAVVRGLQGQIFNNTITNGVHAGIVAANGTTQNRVASNIYSNTIQLSARYTNGFAIIASWGSQIHDNTINCGTNQLSARGILVSYGDINGNTTGVYNNTIHVQQLANNQEYEGEQLGGAYGIQIENAQNVEVYNNNVFAYGNEVPASAFRMNSDGGTSAAVYVHNNKFQAIASGSHAAVLKFTRVEEGTLVFEDNELITNDGFVAGTKSSFVKLIRSRIIVNAPINDPYPISSDYVDGQGLHTRVTFLDTTFADTPSRTYLESATTRQDSRFGGGLNNEIAFDLSWTTTIQVGTSGGQAVSNVGVTIKDKTGAVVSSGMTDGNGRFNATLAQFSTQGGTKTDFGAFTATVMSDGVQINQQFNAEGIQTIQVQLAFEATGNGLILPSLIEEPVLISNAPMVPPSEFEPGMKQKRNDESQSINAGSLPVVHPVSLLIISDFSESNEDMLAAPIQTNTPDSLPQYDSFRLQILDLYFEEFTSVNHQLAL